MKDEYQLYAGKDPVDAEEVRKIIQDYNNAIKDNDFTRYRHIVAMIPANCGLVLDFGCGWGCIARAIAEKGNRVTGIDQFEGALEVASDFNAHPDVQFLNSKITDFIPETFDVVNSNQVLEHVHNPGIYLRNANRVLKPGGFLVISVPNVINFHFMAAQLIRNDAEHFNKISKEALSHYSKDSFHIQSWEPRTFINLLASVGFEYIEHKFVEGMYLPFGKCRHTTLPWRGRYFHTKIKYLSNLSYTMLFKVRKIRYVDIQPED